MPGTKEYGWATLGASTCWLGLRLVFWLYALFVLVRVAGPAGQALGLASEAGPSRSETTGAVLVLLALGALVALFVGLFYATFLFVALHGVDVAVSSSVAATGELASVVTQVGATGTVGQTASVEPALFFPPPVADLFYLIPPVLLLYAGFQARRVGADLAEAVATVVVGYAVVAVVAMVPAAWLFNNVVADVVTDIVSTAATGAALRVTLPDPLVAYLVVCVAYPLVFGSVGALVGGVVAVRNRDRSVP